MGLVVVGPEEPLVNGITDFMKLQGIPCFGPSQKASLIEAEKVYNITSTYHSLLLPTYIHSSFDNYNPTRTLSRSFVIQFNFL